jgi:hypothetical protein
MVAGFTHRLAETLAKRRDNAYLTPMLFRRKNSMWSNVSPTGAVSDFLSVWRTAGPQRWRSLFGALVMTGLVFSLIVREEHRIPPRAPGITYINSWRADRSDAEIKASNLLNQQIKNDKTAEQARADEEVRHIYRTLGKISGMDVDKIERDAAADRAAEAKAKADALAHDAAVRAAIPIK